MKRIAVLVSGGGTNLQAIIDAIQNGSITNGKIVKVIASKQGIFALQRAKENGIAAAVISRKQFDSVEAYDRAMRVFCPFWENRLSGPFQIGLSIFTLL